MKERNRMSCKWLDICPMRRMERQGIIDLSWRQNYCDTESGWKDCERYRMAAQGLSHADTMMPDGSLLERSSP